MKKGYLKVYLKIIFIVLIILVVMGIVSYFVKNQYDDEKIETVKTDMLLIEGKIKIVAEKVRIKEKGADYIGTKVSDMSEDGSIKSLQEKGIIDLNSKEHNYYVIDKSNLEELGLQTIDLQNGYCIVDYMTNEIIYTNGVEDKYGNVLYTLSEIMKDDRSK